MRRKSTSIVCGSVSFSIHQWVLSTLRIPFVYHVGTGMQLISCTLLKSYEPNWGIHPSGDQLHPYVFNHDGEPARRKR
jgi:hypothetical protein